jgi:hypothetical protein
MHITYCNPYESEGIGAQYQRIIAIYSIGKKHNISFIHTKIDIEHNYKNENDWNDKWDKFFNLKLLSSQDTNYSNNVFIKNINMHNINDLINQPILLKCMYPYDIVNKEPNIYYKLIQDDIRKAYDSSIQKKECYLYDKNKMNVAIHIRVHNSKDLQEYKKDFETTTGRFLNDNKKYIEIINKLLSEYTNIDIHIFSQDNFDIKYASLRELPNVKIHLDEIDAFDAFHHMYSADILVIGSSSFSYLAGIYNKNKVMYIPFWINPLDNWIEV